jgi:hypothetical protein
MRVGAGGDFSYSSKAIYISLSSLEALSLLPEGRQLAGR